MERIPQLFFHIVGAPVIGSYVILNREEYIEPGKLDELKEIVMSEDPDSSLTMEQGIYFHYLNSVIFSWEKICADVCTEEDLEVLSNPLGPAVVLQVFLIDIIKFIPMIILSIPGILIWAINTFLYVAGIFLSSFLFAFTLRPAYEYNYPIDIQAYIDFNVLDGLLLILSGFA